MDDCTQNFSCGSLSNGISRSGDGRWSSGGGLNSLSDSGGAGGGWDGTARGTGEALTKSGLVGSASYENMSGGGGGKAIGYLIENAASNHGTLMVNSTPIVIVHLQAFSPIIFVI